MDSNILATDGLLIITSGKITQAWLKGTVSKTVRSLRGAWVRIPHLP